MAITCILTLKQCASIFCPHDRYLNIIQYLHLWYFTSLLLTTALPNIQKVISDGHKEL